MTNDTEMAQLIEGLSKAQKEISPKYFYDERGSELFDAITELPEYYLTNTELGANGIGESGTIGAIAVLWCAVNDALRPLGAQVTKQPFTPEHILDVIAKAGR